MESHRPGFVSSTCLLWLAAIAQLLLLLLQPVPALAADPCPASMALIPGGSYRIGAGAQLPEEQPVRRLRINPFCLDRTEVSNDRFAAFVAATGYVTVAERPLSADQFPELTASERAPGSVVFQPVAASMIWPAASTASSASPSIMISHRLPRPSRRAMVSLSLSVAA